MQSSGDELHQGSWELDAPNLGPSDSRFMTPHSAYIEAGGAACIQGGGGAAAGDGSAFLDLAHMGLFALMESNADNSMLIMSKPADLCIQQSAQFKQGGEERRQLSSAAPPPQPQRRANQQNYSTPTSRQVSRSVPSSPTFATSRLHVNPGIVGGGGSGAATTPGRAAGNRLPIIAKNLYAHMKSIQQGSSSASVLTASLDLASCTSNLLPPSPAGSIRSANFSSDQNAAATLFSDHALKSSNFSSDHSRPTNFTSDHAARSANFGSDHASAARLANFSSDHDARSTNFTSELAAAASFFLPFFPTTPANSTASLNPTAAEQDHHLQAPAASYGANNLGAKKRRLQGAKSKSFSKLVGADGLAATQDTLADVLPLNQGGANVEIAPTEPEMSNDSAKNEGEECAMKGSSSITSSKTQDCDGPPPPKQDYIHVRARRGQATDSHSLAERVRREKISERMKFLQDLVPGCNKITGKAVMLDEIINYVQSLQRQVEFLSMKLSTVSPQTSKFEASHLINHVEPKSIQTSTTLHFSQIKDPNHLHRDLHLSMPLLLDVQQQAPLQHHQHPSNMGTTQAWEDELQSLVQMGFSSLP